jgi:hypothetical protein
MPFTPPRHYKVFEYRRTMDGGMTSPLSVAGTDEEGRVVPLVLKLRNPGTPRGHREGTSLACELICAAIAKAIGMPVPDYGIAEVGQFFASMVGNNEQRTRLLQSTGPNFASRMIQPSTTWTPSCTSSSVALRAAMENVVSMDATILNADRKLKKPNLLWDGANTLTVIDHGLACFVDLLTAPEIAASPLLTDTMVQEHCGYLFLRGQQCTFDSFCDVWNQELDARFWADLRGAIPPTWERAPGDLDRIFGFLQDRPRRFTDLQANLRRIIQ